MRILGFMLVRDEADVIELTIRHHLALLDGIAVLDHASTDGTSEILAALKAEGLPLFLSRDDNPRYRQVEMINRLVRHAVLTTEFDWAVPFDADEFLSVPDRAALERVLGGCPPDRPAILDWPTVVPDFGSAAPLAERLARARRLSDPGHAFRKILAARELLVQPGVSIAMGQHALDRMGGPSGGIPPHAVDPRALELLHVPIRSTAQFVAKFTTGWLSLVAQERRRPNFCIQWRDAFDAIAAGRPIDPATLTAFAANYGIQRDRWRDDPERLLVPQPPFLHAVETRYDALARPLGLASVLKHAERLLIAPR